MRARVTYDGRIETVAWGRSTSTILRLPPETSEGLTAMPAKRVEGEINEPPVNLSRTRAPADYGLLYQIASAQTDATEPSGSRP